MTNPPLTTNQEKFRADFHNQLLSPYEIATRVMEIGLEDELSLEDMNTFMELISREMETGVYLYPPPPITRENQHLHMCEPYDGWMYE